VGPWAQRFKRRLNRSIEILINAFEPAASHIGAPIMKLTKNGGGRRGDRGLTASYQQFVSTQSHCAFRAGSERLDFGRKRPPSKRECTQWAEKSIRVNTAGDKNNQGGAPASIFRQRRWGGGGRDVGGDNYGAVAKPSLEGWQSIRKKKQAGWGGLGPSMPLLVLFANG